MEKGLRGPSLPLSRSIRSSVINLVEKTLARTHTQTHVHMLTRTTRRSQALLLSSSRLSRSARTSVLSRHSRDGKEKDGRVIEGTGKAQETREKETSRPLPLFLSLALHCLDRPSSRCAPSSSRVDEVGMIYARHAEASVTVCLMHWSSLDPLLPPLPSRRPLRSAPFFLLSFRGCLPLTYTRSNPLVHIDRGESSAFSWKPSTPTCT